MKYFYFLFSFLFINLISSSTRLFQHNQMSLLDFMCHKDKICANTNPNIYIDRKNNNNQPKIYKKSNEKEHKKQDAPFQPINTNI